MLKCRAARAAGHAQRETCPPGADDVERPPSARRLALGRLKGKRQLDRLRSIVDVDRPRVKTTLAVDHRGEPQANALQWQRVCRLADDCFGHERDQVVGMRAWARRPVLRDGVVERIAFEWSQRAQQHKAFGPSLRRCRDQVEHTARRVIERG